VAKRFSNADAPDRPLTLSEAAESFGLSPHAVSGIEAFISDESRSAARHRAGNARRKGAQARKFSRSKKR
jgi:hypothetical protein